MDVDAVVLDIDNVLIDTDRSYDRAIVETLSATFGATIDREAIQWFKDAGGFNNDWRVTDAAALFIAASEQGYTNDLRTFTEHVERRGGGLAAAREELADALDENTYDALERVWDQEELRRTFQWAYLGPERYGELEGVEPPVHRPSTTGLIGDETILASETTIETIRDRFPLGFHTGRPRGEALIALERLGFDDPGERLVSMDDWSGGKPDPEGLLSLAERLGASSLAYAGDELDDVRTAVNADRADPDRTYHGIGVQSGGVTGDAGARRFTELGAAAVIDSIDDLPPLLAEAW